MIGTGLLFQAPRWLQIEVVSADITGFLNTLHRHSITIHKLEYVDEITAQFSVNVSDQALLEQCLQKHGGQIRIIQRNDVKLTLTKQKKRILLFVGVLFIFLLTMLLPTRVLFVRVEGNTLIPTNYILSEAEACGLRFGASTRTLRNEQIKNALLEKIPQLSWVGVNIRGFLAVISVKEKTQITEVEHNMPISSIIASRDGVIQQITVTQGFPYCQNGQAVKEGQVLISGYEDLGILIRATQAEGEILAKTQYEIQAVSPISSIMRGAEIGREKKYTLIIGKKQIKLYKDSGILDTSCVKIYDKAQWTLPGGFSLPIALVTEEYVSYESSYLQSSENCFDWLPEYMRQYLVDHMISGTVLKEDATMEFNSEICTFQGVYGCLEEIGRAKEEEIIHSYGKNS